MMGKFAGPPYIGWVKTMVSGVDFPLNPSISMDLLGSSWFPMKS
jgi:hypothetical protein